MKNDIMKTLILLLFFTAFKTLVAACISFDGFDDEAHSPSSTGKPRSQPIDIPGCRRDVFSNNEFKEELKRIFYVYQGSPVGKMLMEENFQELLENIDSTWTKKEIVRIIDSLPAIKPVQIEAIDLLKKYLADIDTEGSETDEDSE